MHKTEDLRRRLVNLVEVIPYFLKNTQEQEIEKARNRYILTWLMKEIVLYGKYVRFRESLSRSGSCSNFLVIIKLLSEANENLQNSC